MRLTKSLAGRLVIWFVVFQSIVSVLALAASLFFGRQVGDEYAFAQMHIADLVADALVMRPDGRLAIQETPALEAFRAERPAVKVAAMRGREVIDGSSPDLSAALRALGMPRFMNATFAFTEGPLAGSVVAGAAVETQWGEVVVVSTDNPLRADDLPALSRYMSGYLVRVMGFVLLGSVLIVPFVIRRALKPLNEASAAAAKIDLRSRDLRLPESEGVPSELLPLVRSINVALDRLDQGFSRQQRFAAEAAHELRTPLAILAARIDSDQNEEQADGMRRDVERMRTLVDQLLLVARLERRDVRLEENVDLVSLARDVVADCTPLAIAGGRDIALAPEVGQAPVRGGRQVLESALINLVHNALRAEPVGGTVEVVVRPHELLVVDHGAGVAPADRENVFDPFWRRDEQHPGAGLGLTIVKETAIAHGGEISIDETPGGGATFRLRIG